MVNFVNNLTICASTPCTFEVLHMFQPMLFTHFLFVLWQQSVRIRSVAFPKRTDTYFEVLHSEVQVDNSGSTVLFNDSASETILEAHSLGDILDTNRRGDESMFFSTTTIKLNCY